MSTKIPRRATAVNSYATDGRFTDELGWFAGETSVPPWTALLYPEHLLLPERWRKYKLEHRDATAPAGFEWLDDRADPRNRPDPATLRAARAAMARSIW